MVGPSSAYGPRYMTWAALVVAPQASDRAGESRRRDRGVAEALAPRCPRPASDRRREARFPREARLLPLVGESGVVSGMQVAECDPDGTDLLAW